MHIQPKGSRGKRARRRVGKSAPSVFICLFLLKLILMSDFAYTFKLRNIFQRDRLHFQVQQQIMASGMPATTEQIHIKRTKSKLNICVSSQMEMRLQMIHLLPGTCSTLYIFQDTTWSLKSHCITVISIIHTQQFIRNQDIK